MKCLNCGKSLGFNAGESRNYYISWKIVNGICTKISLCYDCKDTYEDCLPTKKEEDLYFKNSPKRKRRKK